MKSILHLRLQDGNPMVAILQPDWFRSKGMQFVRPKLEKFITWSIFIQIEKLTPQNRKSRRAQ